MVLREEGREWNTDSYFSVPKERNKALAKKNGKAI